MIGVYLIADSIGYGYRNSLYWHADGLAFGVGSLLLAFYLHRKA